MRRSRRPTSVPNMLGTIQSRAVESSDAGHKPVESRPPSVPAEQPEAASLSSNGRMAIAAAVFAVLVLGSIIFFVMKRRKRRARKQREWAERKEDELHEPAVPFSQNDSARSLSETIPAPEPAHAPKPKNTQSQIIDQMMQEHFYGAGEPRESARESANPRQSAAASSYLSTSVSTNASFLDLESNERIKSGGLSPPPPRIPPSPFSRTRQRQNSQSGDASSPTWSQSTGGNGILSWYARSSRHTLGSPRKPSSMGYRTPSQRFMDRERAARKLEETR